MLTHTLRKMTQQIFCLHNLTVPSYLHGIQKVISKLTFNTLVKINTFCTLNYVVFVKY